MTFFFILPFSMMNATLNLIMGTDNENIKYLGIPVGVAVHGRIGTDVIFRVRPGNGIAGSKVGKSIQDKYAYFVPLSINNPESDPSRTTLATAVYHWQNVLTDEQKAEYNLRATKGLRMSGYNLFIREALLGRADLFVNRGDPAAWDFTLLDFTADGTWRTISFVGIIPPHTKSFILHLHVTANGVDKVIHFRTKGQVNEINHAGLHTQVSAVSSHGEIVAIPDSNLECEYKIDVDSWSEIKATVRGWWI